MATNEKEAAPLWNLRDLYSGISDPALDRDLKKALSLARRFAARYKGRLRQKARDAESLRGILEEYESIWELASEPSAYSGLVFAECCTDQKRGALLQRVRARGQEISNTLLFFDHELLALPMPQLKRFAAAKALHPYRNVVQRLAATRPHRLEEGEERLLGDKALTGVHAFTRLFSEELAAKRYVLKAGRQEKKVPMEELLNLLYHPAQRTRKAAAAAFSAGLREESRRLAFIYNNVVEDHAVNDRYQRYAAPEEARHLDNQTDHRAVEAMAGAVTDYYHVVQEFYRFKRRAMKVERLYDYDRYAPVRTGRQHYSFTWAREQVLTAFARFSPEYAELARDFFTKRWIDAAKRDGKRGGAFCSYVTPRKHPYVFMTYQGSLRDVFTLAHELGHGVHARLMAPQGYLAFDVPLTLAETASVFSEMLLFDHLRSELRSNAARYALYVGMIENIFATVFRQIAMYRFEQDVHRERRTAGELPVERFNALWRSRQQEMFGKSVELTDDYGYWWSYIPHFINTPFYVYAYAFGELLTLSLYARYRREGKPFVAQYLGLLSAGATRSPQELLQPMGIDLHRPAFWRRGLEMIAEMVDEVQELGR